MGKTTVYTDKVGLHIPAPIATKPLWSLGTKVGNFIFTSGQPGVDAEGGIVGEDVQTQTRQAFENLKAILEEGGFQFSDIAKVRVFLNEKEHYEQMNEIRIPYYREQFPEANYPASTALVTGPLAVEGLHVEIEAFACKNKRTYDTDKIVKRIPAEAKVKEQPLWRLGAETDDLLWVTGQPGLDLEARLAGKDIRSQSLQAFKNVSYIVEAGGFSFSDIVKLNTYVADLADYVGMSEVRNSFLTDHFPAGDFPAATAIRAQMPPPGMLVEVEAIAARGPRHLVYADEVAKDLSVEPWLSHGQPSYSQAIRTGNWVFVSGQGPLDKSGKLVGEGDIHAQTVQTLENINKILGAAGAKFEDIVHVTIWLHGPEYYEPLNEARVPYYREHFAKGDFPASTAIIGQTPLDGQLVEIEVIAHSD